MKPRDSTVAGWAAMLLVVFLAVYCAVMAEDFTHTVHRAWVQRDKGEEE